MKFSKRTDWQTGPNRLTSLLKSLKEKGEEVLDLTQANPAECKFSYLDKKLLEPLSSSSNLRYRPEPKGLLEARKAVCRYYAEKNIEVSPEQIFLTPTTSDAYYYLFRLLADPDERILTPKISYPLFDYLASLNEVKLSKYDLIYDGFWHADKKSFERAAEKPFRAMLAVNPNNPTGNFLRASEIEMINAACMKHGAAIIADEVFFDYVLEPSIQSVSLASNREVLTFTLGGISKILGLPQMKLSWIAVTGPEPLRKEACSRLEIIADTYLSINTPVQNALPDWLGKQKSIQAEILRRIKNNISFLKEKCGSHSAVRTLFLEGGWNALLKIDSIRTDEELALMLLDKQKVLIHPGYLFDFPGGSYFVISLLVEPEIFEEGINRIFGQISG